MRQGGPENADLDKAEHWPVLLPEQKLSADHEHVFEGQIAPHAPVRYLRLNILPDGGIAGLRAFGRVG